MCYKTSSILISLLKFKEMRVFYGYFIRVFWLVDGVFFDCCFSVQIMSSVFIVVVERGVGQSAYFILFEIREKQFGNLA